VTGLIDPRRLTTVYRLFDANDRLLYVGTSAEPQGRWEQHAREKLWWSAVTRAEVDWHPSRTDAMAAERAAIQNENPLHNDKATPIEAVFPYQGNRGPSMETVLRRAITEQRKSLDRLAVAVERAALSGLDSSRIAEISGLSDADVAVLAQRVIDGGGTSSLA
jgi:predicted GIY-YIG superfamily endonuclease